MNHIITFVGHPIVVILHKLTQLESLVEDDMRWTLEDFWVYIRLILVYSWFCLILFIRFSFCRSCWVRWYNFVIIRRNFRQSLRRFLILLLRKTFLSEVTNDLIRIICNNIHRVKVCTSLQGIIRPSIITFNKTTFCIVALLYLRIWACCPYGLVGIL
jgi:hypothetical protein